jgi:SAM-dependent methyltransferase
MGSSVRAYSRLVGFDVSAEAYGQFMGRYSEPLALQLVSLVEPRPGQRALDVGCGPGALTAALVERLGASGVSAVDPSPSFVAAVLRRLRGVEAHEAVAEQLPYADDTFDLVLAQLVVHFMSDPVAGLAEMARVARPSGTVAACVWDHAGLSGPLAVFWAAVHDLDPGAPGEAALAGTREGHLAELCSAAGLTGVASTSLTVRVRYRSAEEWWHPFTLGVGPAGGYVETLGPAQREALRRRCGSLLPAAPFEIQARAWCVTAHP